MSAIPEPTLRFPSSLSHRERELWEREAAHLGYFTESAQEVMERHPIEEGEGQILYRKRIETIRRSEAAIEDGRKEEPSQNARTHGFTAKTFRLAPGEREEDYQVRISDSLRRHQPQDTEELDQVVIIVNATWQLLRIQCAASDLMCLNFEEGTTASDALLLHNGTDFNSLSRYEGTQNRTLDKARTRLKELKQERGAAVPAASSPVSHQRPAGAEEEITKRTQDSERGVGVPPAKEEPTSPRADEPQSKITKRAKEIAEDSPSPFPGRERAGVRDGSNAHASEEITKSERSGDPGELSESGRTQEEPDPSRLAPHASHLSSPEPQSPRANEPQQKITKRTQGEGSTKVNPASRLMPALPSAAREYHSDNQPTNNKLQNEPKRTLNPRALHLPPHAPRRRKWIPPFPGWVPRDQRED